jgi:hypothetical protein
VFQDDKDLVMRTDQRDVALLSHPVARQLLQAEVLARLAYTWHDGTPRVVPIGFHWNGREVVLGTAPDAPKMRVLRDGTKVALTIDSANPLRALLIRGSVRVDTVAGIAPEYAAMCRRMDGEEAGQAWVDQLAAGLPRMARIFITPEWVGVMDFERRFQHWLEQALERAQGAT